MTQSEGKPMEAIPNIPQHDLWIDQQNRPFEFSTPFPGEDFVLLLVLVDLTITDEERHAVSAEIVRQGCRYAVCTGERCSDWHDVIDWAYLATDPNFSPPKERLIMTTWHDNQSLDDVAFFFRTCTSFNGFVPQHYLALILGGDATTRQRVRSTIESVG